MFKIILIICICYYNYIIILSQTTTRTYDTEDICMTSNEDNQDGKIF
jgi:hypothetical protein